MRHEPPLKELIQEWLFGQSDLYTFQTLDQTEGWKFYAELITLNNFRSAPLIGLSSLDVARDKAKYAAANYGTPTRIVKVCRTYVNDKFIISEILGICLPPKQ